MAEMALDIREMSFQNVLDQILKPAGVKVGGFPEEMFLDLSEADREKWICNICYLVVNDCRQCDNKHLFCNTCVFAWSMTYGENSQKCPLCRNDQKRYAEHREVNRSIEEKRVKCPEDNCTFKSPLKIFLMHSHGKQKFSNVHVDLESLRPTRPPGSRMLLLPSLALGPIGARNRNGRGTMIRNQLQQGRMMINQMMLLLHLEMQLRQQAFTSFRQSSNSDVRVQRLDEVLALNEQLNEVGTILSNLLNTPLNGTANVESTPNNSETSSTSDVLGAIGGRFQEPRAPIAAVRHGDLFDDSDSESDDCSDSDDSSSLSSTSSAVPRSVPVNAGPGDSSSSMSSINRPQVPSLNSTLRDGQTAIEVARVRRSTTRAVLSGNNESDTTENLAQNNTSSRSTTGLLSRRNEVRNTLSTLNSPEQVTQPTLNVQVIGASRDARVSPREGVQLPQITDSTSSHSGRRSSMVATPRNTQAQSPQSSSSEEAPTQSRTLPNGSSALASVMRDMSQPDPNIQLQRTVTTTVRDDVTISVSSSTPMRRREPSTLQGNNSQSQTSTEAPVTRHAVSQHGNSGHSHARESETASRQVESREESNERELASSTSTHDDNQERRGGAILPASLYRRRNTESGPNNTDSNAQTLKRRSSLTPNRLASQSNTQGMRLVPRGQTSMIGRTQSRSTNQNTESSRRSTQSLRTSHITTALLPNPSVRPKVNVDRARRSSQQNISNGTGRQREAAHSNQSRTSVAQGNVSKRTPNTDNNVARSRRRSEIHQELLMRKDASS